MGKTDLKGIFKGTKWEMVFTIKCIKKTSILESFLRVSKYTDFRRKKICEVQRFPGNVNQVNYFNYIKLIVNNSMLS